MKMGNKGIVRQLLPALIVPLFLLIMTSVFSNFEQNIDRANFTTEANDTYEDVVTGTWSGYKLASQLPFIIIAMVVVGLLIGAFVGAI